jgi:hypothetical protein
VRLDNDVFSDERRVLCESTRRRVLRLVWRHTMPPCGCRTPPAGSLLKIDRTFFSHSCFLSNTPISPLILAACASSFTMDSASIRLGSPVKLGRDSLIRCVGSVPVKYFLHRVPEDSGARIAQLPVESPSGGVVL